MKSKRALQQSFDWREMCGVIVFYRNSLNLNQSQLARLLGVASSTVGVWERGIKEPKVSSLANMARVFGVSETELLHPSEEVMNWVNVNVEGP